MAVQEKTTFFKFVVYLIIFLGLNKCAVTLSSRNCSTVILKYNDSIEYFLMTCLQLEMNAVCFSCNITFGAHECSNSECIKVQSQISSKPVNCKVDMTGIYNDTCSIMKPLNESGQNASVYFYNQSVVIAVVKVINRSPSFTSDLLHSAITVRNATSNVFFSETFYTTSSSSHQPSSVSSSFSPSFFPSSSFSLSYSSFPSSILSKPNSTMTMTTHNEGMSYLYIGIGSLFGFLMLLLCALISGCCFMLCFKRKRRRQANFEMQENTVSILTTQQMNAQDNTLPRAFTNAGYEKQNSPHSASFSTSQTITSPSVTPYSPKYHGGHIRFTPTQKDEIFNDDETMMKGNSFLVRDSFPHWRSVFSKMIIRNEDIEVDETENVGEGAFGRVLKGTLNSIGPNKKINKVEVAVKTLKAHPTPDQVEEFISESAIMLDFNHPNVLTLLGVCFDTEHQLPLIILPYMANGDLKSYLRSERKIANRNDEFPEALNHDKLVYMCLDIARGMEYLARKKFVHRDLAARNCVTDKDLSVKIADFGQSRDIYTRDYYRMGLKPAKVPVKWLPPESLYDGIFNEKTDIWAFGVTCWEIFSLGRNPYPSIDNAEILDHIESGHRLKKPPLCQNEMFNIINTCWKLDSKDRPQFSNVVCSICIMLRDNRTDEESEDEEPKHNYFLLEEHSAFLDRLLSKKESKIILQNQQQNNGNCSGDLPEGSVYTNTDLSTSHREINMAGQLQNDPENTTMEYTHIPAFHNTAYDHILSIPTFHNTAYNTALNCVIDPTLTSLSCIDVSVDEGNTDYLYEHID